jgi:tRNA 2-selenouridine synthase
MTIPATTTCIVFFGKTGSGKTMRLQQLEATGYPTINIERIALHRGSAFGGLLLPPQPCQDDFERALQQAFLFHSGSPAIFIEYKVSPVGKLRIPGWLQAKLEEGITVQLLADKKVRVRNILKEYGAAGKESFINALRKLTNRLTAINLQQLEALLQQEDYASFISLMLEYYDAAANYNNKIPMDINLPVSGEDICDDATKLLAALNRLGVFIS